MNTEIISAILNILSNKETVDFNQLAVTIISGLNSNKTSEQSNKKSEELHNLTSIVKAAEKNSVIGDYISEDCKQKVEHIVKTFEYMSDRLTDEQVDAALFRWIDFSVEHGVSAVFDASLDQGWYQNLVCQDI